MTKPNDSEKYPPEIISDPSGRLSLKYSRSRWTLMGAYCHFELFASAESWKHFKVFREDIWKHAHSKEYWVWFRDPLEV